MTFQTVALDALPKRTPRGFDADKANSLLAAATAAPESGASDGTEYATEDEARTAAQKHKRLLANVAPPGQVARSRTFPIGDGYGWAVYLGEPPAEATKRAKSK